MPLSRSSYLLNAPPPPPPPIENNKFQYAIGALCITAFSVSYMLVSVFPYVGFMAIQLIGNDKLTEENVGIYAGLLASAFNIGRMCTSYIWGKMSDIYGRHITLSLSIIWSSIFCFTFGLSNNYYMAFMWRFTLGLSNGILPITKTLVSEIATSKEEETNGMALVMGMWGWGFLFAPAIAGLTSEPITQYPNSTLWDNTKTWYYQILNDFPFFIPNFIGAVLGFIALGAVNVYIQETLPKQRIHPISSFPSNVWSSLKRVLSIIPEESFEELSPLMNTNRKQQSMSNYTTNSNNDNESNNDNKRSSYADSRTEDELDSEEFQNLQNILDVLGNDMDGAIRESQVTYDETVLLSTAKNSRESLTMAVQKRSSIAVQRKRASRLSTDGSVISHAPTMSSLWAQRSTRSHMIVYWIASFVMVATDEAFPLYCISKVSGLGLSEKEIGKVLSISGILFVAGQYGFYTWFINKFGLYGSIRIGSILFGPMLLLIPISLPLNNYGATTTENSLTMSSLVYLSIVMAIYRIFCLAYFSSLTVALNRTVLPSHRGTMNGLSTLGGSIAKALGPSFAGALVSLSFTSFSHPHLGAVFMWSVLGILGGIVTISSYTMLHDDEEDDANNELKV